MVARCNAKMYGHDNKNQSFKVASLILNWRERGADRDREQRERGRMIGREKVEERDIVRREESPFLLLSNNDVISYFSYDRFYTFFFYSYLHYFHLLHH